MPVTQHDRDDNSTDKSMVGSNVAAQRVTALWLADEGEEKPPAGKGEEREDYGSTGDNERRSDAD